MKSKSYSLLPLLCSIIFIFITTNISSQVLFTAYTITGNANGAYSVYAVDVDGDGDTDVLSASFNDNKIAWFENDGEENFISHTITDSLRRANAVYAVDVDGDGDIDVLAAATWTENLYVYGNVSWYENDGEEYFTSHTISTDVNDARSVYAVDVDGDGDIDVLSASNYDDKISWHENDGNENFTPHTITTNADGAVSVYAIDLDGDDDMDVLSASWYDDKIAWYENDGYESFTSHTITSGEDRASSVFALDVDSDGDIDVLSASYGYDRIAWYENMDPVGIDDNNQISDPVQFKMYNNYPNPFNPSTRIQYAVSERQFVSLKVYDVLGNEVATLVNEEKPAGSYEVEFKGDGLTSGIYFYRFKAGGFVSTNKMVLMK